MAVSWDLVDDMALALLHLTTFRDHGVVRAWKGLNWDVLDRLQEHGWILNPRTPAKSVVLTQEGLERSRESFERHFGALEPEAVQGAEAPARNQEGPAGNPATPAAPCQCGCGEEAGSRDFLPGHDQKLRIMLERRVGGLLELRSLMDVAEAYARGNLSLEQLGLRAQAAMTCPEDGAHSR
jgi:hypothetical protein